MTLECTKLMRSNQPQDKFFLIGFKSSFNWLFRSEIVATIQIRTRIWSKMSIYIKNRSTFLIEIDFFNLLIDFIKSFNRLFWSLYQYFNQNRLKIDQKQLNLDQNRDRWLESVVVFWIGPKSTINFGWLGIQIIDDSILEAESH